MSATDVCLPYGAIPKITQKLGVHRQEVYKALSCTLNDKEKAKKIRAEALKILQDNIDLIKSRERVFYALEN